MLKELGCNYMEKLAHDVDYLIVNHTCTEKFKVTFLLFRLPNSKKAVLKVSQSNGCSSLTRPRRFCPLIITEWRKSFMVWELYFKAFKTKKYKIKSNP